MSIMKVCELIDSLNQEESVIPSNIKTYDLVYSSASRHKIHARVWKEMPEGLVKVRLGKITKDRKEGTVTVRIVGTIEDGTRTVMSRPMGGGDCVEVEVPKYKNINVEKILHAKGVSPSKIKLRLVDADVDYWRGTATNK